MEMKIPLADVGADLRAFQYRAVAIGGTLATGPLNANAISCTKVDSGEDGSGLVQGRSFFIAGGAISAGGRMQVTSGGYMTAATSGDTSCGFAEITVTSGSVGRGVVDFTTMTYHVSSNG